MIWSFGRRYVLHSSKNVYLVLQKNILCDLVRLGSKLGGLVSKVVRPPNKTMLNHCQCWPRHRPNCFIVWPRRRHPLPISGLSAPVVCEIEPKRPVWEENRGVEAQAEPVPGHGKSFHLDLPALPRAKLSHDSALDCSAFEKSNASTWSQSEAKLLVEEDNSAVGALVEPGQSTFDCHSVLLLLNIPESPLSGTSHPD